MWRNIGGRIWRISAGAYENIEAKREKSGAARRHEHIKHESGSVTASIGSGNARRKMT